MSRWPRATRASAHWDSSSTETPRLRRSLKDIYSRVSAGVHDDVTIDEARYLFLATYVLLGEILAAAHDIAA